MFFNHIYDVDLRTFVVLLRAFRFHLYVIFIHIYAVNLRNLYTYLQCWSTYFLLFIYVLLDCTYTWFPYISTMLIYVFLLFFYVLFNFSFYVILEHIYVLRPTWKFVLLRTFGKARRRTFKVRRVVSNGCRLTIVDMQKSTYTVKKKSFYEPIPPSDGYWVHSKMQQGCMDESTRSFPAMS